MKYFIFTVVFIFLAVGLIIYLLPFIAYYQIESAIVKRDVGTLVSYVDFDQIRGNLKAQKGQRVIKMARKDDVNEPSLADLAIIWSSLSSDQEIEKAVSTAGLYIALSGSGAERKKPDPIKPTPEMSSYQMVKRLIADSSFQYGSLSKFVVSAKDGRNRYVQYFSFVFTREGVHWRLTNVIIPVF